MRELIARRWSEIEPLFDALIELAPEQRQARLERDCDDIELRAAVTELLARDVESENSLERIAAEIGAPVGGLEGQRIGPYRIERLLGEGGMGAVFLAERQTAEFTQRVALKLLRVGLFSASQQEQFRREQRIHARLEHPHIAHVLDSGITAAGVPYFAMEYVDGVPLTTYCDAHRLSIDPRLHLFATICDAVAYAHRNLIVHRDLKPSNILVDGAGEPHLLDFGIAKLLSTETSSERTHTELRRLTPDYAAPEQFGDGTVTTATDVYALGVLLCELLTGARPANADDSTSPLRSVARNADVAVADARGTTSKALRRRLNGDLDAIVTKALQRDPARRYGGAAALRDDIQRHLAGQPIRAHPDAWTYRAEKFIQRHKFAVAAALLIVATLLAASVFSLHQADIARREAAHAQQEAARATAVKQFLLHLFYSSAPATSDKVETADAMLERGQQQSTQELAATPALQAEVLATVGDVQRRRGKLDAAAITLEQAAQIGTKALAPSDPKRLEIVTLQARLSVSSGRFADGLKLLDTALADYRAANSPEHSALAYALEEHGVLQMRLGHYSEAVADIESALAMYRRLVPDDDGNISDALSALSEAQMYNGAYEASTRSAQEVVDRARRNYGNNHLQVAEALNLLAATLRQAGHLAEAETALGRAVEIQRGAYSEPAPSAAVTLNDLAVTQMMQGKYADAEASMTQALDIARKVYKGDSVNTAAYLDNLGRMQHVQGHYAQAEPLERQALEMTIRVRGADHPRVALTQVDLAQTLIELNRFDEAASLLDAALAIDYARFGQKHEAIGGVLAARAKLTLRQGKPEATLVLIEQARDQLDALAPKQPRRIELQLLRADALLALNRADDALAEASAARDNAEHAETPLALTIARTDDAVARAQLARNDPASAQQALALARKHLDAAPSADSRLRGELDELERRLPAAK